MVDSGPVFPRLVASRLKGAVVVVVLSAGACSADTLLVPQDFPTIQSAIAAAVNGDEVVVAPGTYVETIDFLGKAIVVRSTDGAAATTIDGGGGEVFVVSFVAGEGPAATLRGFTITGGLGRTAQSSTGAGIRVIGASPTLRDLIVVGNTGLFGGGLQAFSSEAVLEDVAFEANLAHTGGGAYFEGGAPTLTRVSFTGNDVTNNGGGLAAVATDIMLSEAEFTANSSNSFGGGVFLNTATIDASDILMRDNGTASTDSFGTFTFSTFGGGGIYTTHSSGRIDRARFLDNNAFAGGGVYVAGSGTIELVNTVVAGSVTALGGVYANSSSPVIANCTIVNNQTFGLFTTYNAFPTVRNSIFSGQTNIASTEIAGNGLASVRYSIINGDAFSATLGDGVLLDAAPQLNDNFAPLPGSPAIDAGDNSAVPAGVALDLLGGDRFADDAATPDTGLGTAPIVDIGAVEFGGQASCVGDFDLDGQYTTGDFFVYLTLYQIGHSSTDIDGNGVINTNDFFAFLAHYHAGC